MLGLVLEIYFHKMGKKSEAALFFPGGISLLDNLSIYLSIYLI